MPNTIVVKKSSVAGKVPLTTDLLTGELAANLTDRYLYSKDGSGSVFKFNAGSADQLKTSVTINGVSFNGTSNITITDSTKLPLSGGTLTGTVNAPTFNATATTGGGFQGIDADTAAQPSFTWTADLDTGIYRPAADVIGFTAGGVERGRINTTGFSGNGSQLTSLNANNLESGTIPNARLSGSYGISITGNAGTATTLATARTINGTSFNGSANITTSSWGTARTITIGNTAKSVDGGGNVSWNGTEIGFNGLITTISDIGTMQSRFNYPVGRKLLPDEEFRDGLNGISVYNNSGGTAVTVTRLTNQTTIPNSSGNVVRVSYNGTGPASPGNGGFTFSTPTRANARYVARFLAKVPTDRSLLFASNATGNETVRGFLTPNVGTGRWEEYAFEVICGFTGSFSSTNFFFLDGSGAYNIDIASATVIDVTNKNILADQASTLVTPRNINGTSFNGSANITTANWGTARNLTIGNTAKSVNGSANVGWTLAEIGALGATATAVAATKLETPRLINGVPFDGTQDITIAGGGGGLPTAVGFAPNPVNANQHFFDCPPGQRIISEGSQIPGAPNADWGFLESIRHTNGTSSWGVQYFHGWTLPNDRKTYIRGVDNGNFSAWQRVTLPVSVNEANSETTFLANVYAPNAVPVNAVAKAWIAWQGSPATIRSVYGPITGITRVSTGVWDISFSPGSMTNSNYVAAGWCRTNNTTSGAVLSQLSTQTVTDTTFRVEARNNGGTLIDTTYASLVFFGGN